MRPPRIRLWARRDSVLSLRDSIPILLLSLTLPALICCGKNDSFLTAEMPLHLEEHLDTAVVDGSRVPEDLPEPVIWDFSKEQPDWHSVEPLLPGVQPALLDSAGQGLRVTLTEETNHGDWQNRLNLYGGIYVELPEWNREDWGEILVRARTTGKVEYVEAGFNLREELGEKPFERFPFLFFGGEIPMLRDGSEQTYRIPADRSIDYSLKWEGPWKQLGIAFGAHEPVTVEVLSVSVIPKEARYTESGVGVRTEARSQEYRRVIYSHAPGKIRYRLEVPRGGRLDVGLGVLRDDIPQTFRVSVASDEGQTVLLEKTYADRDRWQQERIDLASFEGEVIDLSLETESERSGTVTLWAAPTLSGQLSQDKPDVIFYIIDGAGADYMSVYGYNRRTTPHLERLVREGTLFENAYSNCSWTRPSTLTFLTSLHHSAMGGMRNNRNAPPEEYLTISERLHRAGYQTALFTSNPNAATMSQLDRGVDVLREKSVQPTSVSTRELHTDFWRWRQEYPGRPYWVHFQTTDVHWPHNPPLPFAGLFVSPERRSALDEMERKLNAAGVRMDPWSDSFEKASVDRVAYFAGKRDLYAEAMAHQDAQLGRLVDRLKERGEWDQTILIIAADHGVDAGAWDYDIAMMDPLPPPWGPRFRPGVTRIPMIFVGPGLIPAGKRIRTPVSMIDMVPTILDLLEEPSPNVTMGQSLVPLMKESDGWEPRPIILDEFYEDANSRKMMGWIEVVDGRWGASLEIVEDPEADDRPSERKRPVPLLLYDLWEDPLCLNSLHEERADLVAYYTDFLTRQLEAHRSAAQLFTRPADVPLSPEQLQTLEALGYIH